MAEPIELTVPLAAALDRAGVAHAFGEAIALAAAGAPRATVDLDVNLFVKEEALPPVLDVLEKAGCRLDKGESLRRAKDRGDFRGVYEGYRADFFISFHEYHDEVARRVLTVPLGGGAIRVLSAEDLAVFKVLFDRPKDWVDLESLAAARGSRFDRKYVSRWLRELLPSKDPRIARMRGLMSRYRK